MKPGPFGPWRALIVVCVLVSALSVVMGPVLFVRGDNNADRLEEIAQQNRVLALKLNNSLCALRADLETRVATSEEFIKDHPEGFAGISVEEIERGLANQRSTIEALSDLNC